MKSRFLLVTVFLLLASLLNAQENSFDDNLSTYDFQELIRVKNSLEIKLNTFKSKLSKLQSEEDSLATKQLQFEEKIMRNQESLTNAKQALEDAKNTLPKLKDQNIEMKKLLKSADDGNMSITTLSDTLQTRIQNYLTLNYDSSSSTITKEILNNLIEQNDKQILKNEETTDKAPIAIANFERSIKLLDNQLLTLKDIPQNITKLEDNIDATKIKLDKIYYKINSKINQEEIKNKFKRDISLGFMVLVAIVIGGFYSIILIKGRDSIVETLFAGHQGILFITLFLIIISIILFGIMGTLGREELSALIGAIAGYILGSKSTQPSEPSDSYDPR